MGQISNTGVQLLETGARKQLTSLVPSMFSIFILITLFLAVTNYHVKKGNDWKYFKWTFSDLMLEMIKNVQTIKI